MKGIRFFTFFNVTEHEPEVFRENILMLQRSDRSLKMTMTFHKCAFRENKPPNILILTLPRRNFCCDSLLLLVLAVRIYTLVQLLC